MIKSEIFASVLRDVCEVTGISARDIMSKSKSEEIVDARHLLVVTLRRSGYYPGMIAERLHVSGRAVNAGDCSVIQAIKDCCCQTQQNIIRMGYENQLGQKDILERIQSGLDFVNRGVERGFSATAFQAQQDKCDVIRAGQDNTQRIIDTLNLHWQQDLQQRYNDARLELSQQRQNAQLIAALKTTGTTTTA